MTTTVDLLDCLRAHLAAFELPDLCSLHLTRSFSGHDVTAQLACHTPPQIASGLLAWADTLTDVTAEAWRVPRGDCVHLSVIGCLPGEVPIRIYGGVPFTPHGLGRDLAPDTSTTVALAVLRGRATLGEVTL
ncbi:MAG: hypothetical protein ACRDS9_23970 [Pseudonocardiaceae bacterium]